jgi:predicted amidophosphoribosyltransferase
MASSKELCSVCGKPFEEKQNSTYCGVCDSCFHYACLQLGGNKQVFYSSAGNTSYPPERKSYFSELTSNVQTETVRLSKQTTILFINDVPTITSKNANLVLYTDNTSIIITSPSSAKFSTKVNTVFVDING